jgi:3-hydroxyisobutyrate dehydrogenase-like beta-hydroxyacid dehydrogenase
MKRAGVIGLGDMGSGLAKNLIANGFETSGFDLNPKRQAAFVAMGGRNAASPADVGRNAQAVFVMVLNGQQARSAIFGRDGLAGAMKPGSSIIMTATIKPAEAAEIGADVEAAGLRFVDSPVTGGYSGAQNGTLTIMVSAPKQSFEDHQKILSAVGKKIFHVGEAPGMGQVMKACLQSLIGSIFTATFEAAVLAAKSGVSGQALFDVFTNSSAGSIVTNNALQKILDRTFVGTGSHIATMYKDLTISLDHARDAGVPLFTAAAAMQLFQAGKTRFPDEDNWAVTKVVEDIVGAKVAW